MEAQATSQVLDGNRTYRNAYRRGLKPDRYFSVSDWADQNRLLDSKTSAEPGPWQTSRTPYLREIMDNLSARSPFERVVFMKSAQIGGTEAGNNWVGCAICTAPGPMLMILPNLDAAKETSKIRISTMIATTPALAELVSEARTRDSGNSMLLKEFRGGFLGITGANSSVGLRSKAVRNLFCDEIDEYPLDVGGQGDPLLLAIRRTTTYANRKIFLVSTPTIDEASRIQAEYMKTDQRRWFVPCPECGDHQVLTWENVKFEETETGRMVWYECDTCGVRIPERKKTWMVERGEWRATAPAVERTVGYHLNALVSPWVSWSDMVAEFLKAKKSPEFMRTFVNTMLGECWREDTEEQEPEALAERREEYGPMSIPAGVAVLTAGADIQKDRIEMEVVGWGRDGESWGIAHHVLRGDPESLDTWDSFDLVMFSEFKTIDGRTLRIKAAAIDSGYLAPAVYRYCRARAGLAFPVKGYSGESRPLVTRGSKVGKPPVRLFQIGVDGAKEMLFARMKIAKHGPGCMHFPRAYTDEWFAQLCGERRTREKYKGGFRFVWKKHRANEALDMRVYAMAAVDIRGIPVNREVARIEAARAYDEGEPIEAATETDEVMETTKPNQARRKAMKPPRRRGGYTNWKG